MPKPGKCKLCGEIAVLRQSHVIPAFVIRWLKETSATGFLRGPAAPNRRVQDIPTEPILCGSCEQRFSVAEERFAREVFVPFHEGHSRFQYESWLSYFAISLAWRCLVVAAPEELSDLPQHAESVEGAKNAWTALLLGREAEAEPYRHNLLFVRGPISSRAHLPEGLAWYLLRAADICPVSGDDEVAMFAKLPGMIFWSSVKPPDPGGWRGTKISKRGTMKAGDQAINDPAIGTWLVDRAAIAVSQRERLSETQRARIEHSLRINPVRLQGSASLRAFLEEQRVLSANRRKGRA